MLGVATINSMLEAQRGWVDLGMPTAGRSTAISRRCACEAMGAVCEAKVEPQLQVDQIADFALYSGLKAFQEKKEFLDFIRVIVSGGLLEDGVVFNG